MAAPVLAVTTPTVLANFGIGLLYLLPVPQLKVQSASAARKHDGLDCRQPVFQRKIDMARGVVLAVRHLSLNGNAAQGKVLSKHVFNVGVYLGN